MSSRLTLARVLTGSSEQQLPPLAPAFPPSLLPVSTSALPSDFENGFRARASTGTSSAIATAEDVHRAATSVLGDRLRFAQTVFGQFGGRRDFRKVLGYKQTLSFDDYLDYYERGDVATRIIDIPAEETWFDFPKLVDADGEDGKFARSWVALSRHLNLPEVFCRLDRASGIGRYGVAVVGLRDGLPLESPAGKVSSVEDVLYVSIYSEGSAIFGAPSDDFRSELYGKPEMYTVDLSRSMDMTFDSSVSLGQTPRMTTRIHPGSPTTRQVHASRIIHYCEGRLESDLFGPPRLKAVFNRLFDLAKIIGGSAETFWLVANKGLHANIDPQVARTMKKDALDKLAQDLELYRDQITRFLRTIGVDIQDLGSDTVNPRGPFAVVAAVIAGTTKIPLRMLFPETRGAQTSTNDRVAFREEIILPRQVRVAEVQAIRPFAKLMINVGALPKPNSISDLPNDFDVVWPDPVARSRSDQADIAQVIATAVANFAKARSAGVSSVSLEEERKILGLHGDAPEQPEPSEPDTGDPNQPPGAKPPNPANPDDEPIPVKKKQALPSDLPPDLQDIIEEHNDANPAPRKR